MASVTGKVGLGRDPAGEGCIGRCQGKAAQRK